MSETFETEDEREQDENDGFNVIAEMSPVEWVDYGFDDHSEYVHLIADKEARELRCYRSVSEPMEMDNKRIKTTISDVKFRYYFEDEAKDIDYWYLTYMEAMTFMSFIELMNGNRQGQLLFEWSEADGGPMMDDEATTMECITLTYTKVNGVERHAQIRSEWQSPGQKMANIEGEGY